jgi:hypothetical protein
MKSPYGNKSDPELQSIFLIGAFRNLIGAFQKLVNALPLTTAKFPCLVALNRRVGRMTVLRARPFLATDMTYHRHRFTLVSVFLWLLSFSTFVSAETASEDQKRAARAAAEAGYEALVAEDYAAALKFLARAERDYHAPTHLLMMAEAYEKLGKLVEAREVLLSVVNERVDENASEAFLDAQKQASERVAALEPRVPRVTIRVVFTREGRAISAEEGQVFLNDARVPTSAFDAPYPINPGDYQARIRLDDTDGNVVGFAVEEGEVKEIELRVDAPALAVVDQVDTRGGRESTHPMVYVGFGVGGLGIIAGSITGVMAMSKVSSLKKDHCQGTTCDPAYQDEFGGAETLGWVSTASFAVGVGGVAVGLYYLLTGSSGDAPQDSASLSPRVSMNFARDLAYTNATWTF